MGYLGYLGLLGLLGLLGYLGLLGLLFFNNVEDILLLVQWQFSEIVNDLVQCSICNIYKPPIADPLFLKK